MRKSIERHYRIDERTAARIRERSQHLKISESEYARRLILQDLYPLDQARMKEIVRQIATMANGINQIAIKANDQNLEKEDLCRIDSFRMNLATLNDTVLKMKKTIEGGDG